ncbi:DUF262 domain-containing HNH endonuclease family protein [Helicobacter pylori]|uniref:DUF262 domain-containing protein n=1 Tax=Helicobacter pylori TaxID=210 RepID=UPI000C310735|nr:DUF262 domain-containing protein [Helicobacter pylori]WRE52914.1 DUF262 domain-containing HNH endonuclease family protein [Helicobacter pylori]
MELLNLDGVIEKGVFEIPSYQRGYAWQEEQLKDFWNDLEHVSKLGDKFHYMHSLTLRESENEFESSAFEIIDGQQRLATSLILLGLLAKITQNKDPKYSLINLEPILSYKYYGLSEAFRAITEEEKDLERFQTSFSSFYAKNLIDAYAFFKEKISNTPVGTLEKMFDALIKKMLFSVVELNDNRIDPFSSFETINNRGKDLSTLELLKNRLHFVAHKICDEEDLENLQQEINDTYTRIYHDLRRFEDAHLESFLKHFVAYYYGEKSDFKGRLLNTAFDAHKKYDDLYDEYEKINDLLLYLSHSSKVWYFLHTLDDEELRIEITPKMRGLLDKMRRLNALSNNAFLPLLLSLLTIQLAVRSGSERHYTTKELEGLLEYLERFGFLIYGVAGSKNTAKKEWIGLAFKAIQACRFWEDKITIEDLPTLEKNFFKGKHSGLELLEENIHSKKNTEKWYQWGKALNYLLYEYELHHNPETTLKFDSSIESIEHILPQNPDQGYSAKEKNWAKNPHIVHALGNLLLIAKNANSSLSNKPFDEKRKEYLKGSYSEKEVAKNASFGITEIQERSEKLLDFLIARYNIAELVGENAIKAFKNALLKEIK